MFILLIIIIILSIMVYFYYKFNKKDSKKFIPNNEFKNNEKKNAKLILFYTTWCPYCKDTIEKFNNYKIRLTDKDYYIQYDTIDCDEEKSLAELYKIDSYPTIILLYNENKYIYDANFSEETMDKFLNVILN